MDQELLFISEIGNNHNGSIENAKKLVDLALSTGSDAVKFQMRNLESLYRKKTINKVGEDLGSEYIIDLLKKYELNINEHKKIREYCKKKKLIYICTPWDVKSLKVLETFDVDAYNASMT